MGDFIKDVDGHYYNLEEILMLGVLEQKGSNNIVYYNVYANTSSTIQQISGEKSLTIKSYTNLNDAENYLNQLMADYCIN